MVAQADRTRIRRNNKIDCIIVIIVVVVVVVIVVVVVVCSASSSGSFNHTYRCTYPFIVHIGCKLCAFTASVRALRGKGAPSSLAGSGQRFSKKRFL